MSNLPPSLDDLLDEEAARPSRWHRRSTKLVIGSLTLGLALSGAAAGYVVTVDHALNSNLARADILPAQVPANPAEAPRPATQQPSPTPHHTIHCLFLSIHLRTAPLCASRPAPRHVRLIACAAHSTGLTLTLSTCIYPFSFIVILHNGRGRPQLLLRLQRCQAAFHPGRLVEPRPATPYPPACARGSPASNTTTTCPTNAGAANTATVRIRRGGTCGGIRGGGV